MDSFSSLTPRELAVLTTILAVDIAKGRSINDQLILGSMFDAVGDLITLMATQQQIQNNKKKSTNNASNTNSNPSTNSNSCNDKS